MNSPLDVDSVNNLEYLDSVRNVHNVDFLYFDPGAVMRFAPKTRIASPDAVVETGVSNASRVHP